MADIEFDCPKCNGHLAVDEKGAGLQVKCPDCGNPILIPDNKPNSEKNSIVPSVPFNPDNYCPKCGEEITSPEKQFCSNCGYALKKSAPTVHGHIGTKNTCPKCKRVLAKDDLVCVACGIYVKTGKRIGDANPSIISNRKRGLIFSGIFTSIILLVGFFNTCESPRNSISDSNNFSETSNNIQTASLFVSETSSISQPSISSAGPETISKDLPRADIISTNNVAHVVESVSSLREKEYSDLKIESAASFHLIPLLTSIKVPLVSGNIISGKLTSISADSISIDINGASVTILRQQITLTTRRLLFVDDFVDFVVNSKRQSYRQSDTLALNNAFERIKHVKFFEDAIDILDTTIKLSPYAPQSDIENAMNYSAELKKALAVVNRNIANGLVQYNGKWMTPAQRDSVQREEYLYARQQEEEQRRELSRLSRGGGGIGHTCFPSYDSAQNYADTLNRNSQGYLDASQEAGIDRAGFEGESVTVLPAASLNTYTVVNCENHPRRYRVQAAYGVNRYLQGILSH
jgi:hypothetical protein